MMQTPLKALILALALAMPASLFAQEPPTSNAQLSGPAPDVIAFRGQNEPLFFRESWKVPPVNHSGAFSQKNVASPHLELHLYGSAKDTDPARGLEQGMQANRGPIGFPAHIFSGLCEQPCAASLRDKRNYVDLSGLGKIRWLTAVTGLHQVHPLLKLADGTWILGEYGDGTVYDYHPYEFTLSEIRWIKMDMERVVARGRWLDAVDLSKVDEVGFTDLMPGSGHGDGGFSDVGWIEVYGKPVPR
jgi:hypothetical protein